MASICGQIFYTKKIVNEKAQRNYKCLHIFDDHDKEQIIKKSWTAIGVIVAKLDLRAQ